MIPEARYFIFYVLGIHLHRVIELCRIYGYLRNVEFMEKLVEDSMYHRGSMGIFNLIFNLTEHFTSLTFPISDQ